MQSQIRLFLVHGVGPFDKKATVRAVEEMAYDTANIEDCEAFDWCDIVGDPFRRLPQIGRAFLRLPHLRKDHSSVRCTLFSVSVLIFQFVSLLIGPAVLFCVVDYGITQPLIGLRLKSDQFVVGILIVCFGLAIPIATLSEACEKFGVGPFGVRQIGMSLLWPIVHLVGSPQYLNVAVWPLLVVTVAIPFFVLQGFVLVMVPSTVTSDITWYTFWHTGALIIVVILVSIISSLIIIYVTYPTIKAVADVALWIDSGEYRTRLRSWFVKLLAYPNDLRFDTNENLRFESGEHVIIVAHSLGTVIAIDGIIELLNRGTTLPKLTLVTMGSPLLGLLHRFFPAEFSVPAEIAAWINYRSQNFEWLNVFRPRDPIGRSLHLGKYGVDISTGQQRNVLNAHVDYWSDAEVFKCVQSYLAVGMQRADDADQPKQISWPGSRSNVPRFVDRILQANTWFVVLVTALVCSCPGIAVVYGNLDSMFSSPLAFIGACIPIVFFGALVLLGWTYSGLPWLSSLIGSDPRSVREKVHWSVPPEMSDQQVDALVYVARQLIAWAVPILILLNSKNENSKEYGRALGDTLKRAGWPIDFLEREWNVMSFDTGCQVTASSNEYFRFVVLLGLADLYCDFIEDTNQEIPILLKVNGPARRLSDSYPEQNV